MSVIKTASSAVEITPFHKDVFAIARTGHKAGETMAQKMRALLISKYGQPVVSKAEDGTETRAGGPSFEQYRADRRALAQLAKERGLESDQWVRKPFCAAVIALYGKLPESQSPEALRKAEERRVAQEAVKAHKAAQEAAAKPGAPAGQTQDRQPTEAEQIEALVARIGLMKTLDACLRILEADDKTKGQAVHMRKMAVKVAEQLATA